jgi:outer membrane protein insertion porin family
MKTLLLPKIENKYKRTDTNTKVNINVVKDTATVNQVNMVVTIDKGEK